MEIKNQPIWVRAVRAASSGLLHVFSSVNTSACPDQVQSLINQAYATASQPVILQADGSRVAQTAAKPAVATVVNLAGVPVDVSGPPPDAVDFGDLEDDNKTQSSSGEGEDDEEEGDPNAMCAGPPDPPAVQSEAQKLGVPADLASRASRKRQRSVLSTTMVAVGKLVYDRLAHELTTTLGILPNTPQGIAVLASASVLVLSLLYDVWGGPWRLARRALTVALPHLAVALTTVTVHQGPRHTLGPRLMYTAICVIRKHTLLSNGKQLNASGQPLPAVPAEYVVVAALSLSGALFTLVTSLDDTFVAWSVCVCLAGSLALWNWLCDSDPATTFNVLEDRLSDVHSVRKSFVGIISAALAEAGEYPAKTGQPHEREAWERRVMDEAVNKLIGAFASAPFALFASQREASLANVRPKYVLSDYGMGGAKVASPPRDRGLGVAIRVTDADWYFTREDLEHLLGYGNLVVFSGIRYDDLSGATGARSLYRYVSADHVTVVGDMRNFTHHVWNYEHDAIYQVSVGHGLYVYRVIRHDWLNRQVVALVPVAYVPGACMSTLPAKVTAVEVPNPLVASQPYLVKPSLQKRDGALVPVMQFSDSRSFTHYWMTLESWTSLLNTSIYTTESLLSSRVKTYQDLGHCSKGETMTIASLLLHVLQRSSALPQPLPPGANYTFQLYDNEPATKPTMRALDKCFLTALLPHKGRAVERHTVEKRITSLRNNTWMTANNQDLLRYAHEFVQLVLADIGKPLVRIEETKEIEARMNRPTQVARRVHYKGHYDIPAGAKLKVRAFQKVEEYSEGKPPRNISTVEAAHLMRLGAYIYPLVEDGLALLSWYGYGKAPSIVTEIVADVCSGGSYDCDFSKFDARKGLVENYVFRQLVYQAFPDYTEPANLLAAELFAHGRTTSGIAYNVGTSQLSGSLTTTIANTVTNAFYSFAAYRRAGFTPANSYRSLGIYAGDDSKLRANLPVADFKGVMADCGMKYTLEKDDGPYMRFLGRVYLDPANPRGQTMADPARALRKLHLYRNGQRPEEALANRAQGLLVTDRHTPILGLWASSVAHIFRTGEIDSYRARDWVKCKHVQGSLDRDRAVDAFIHFLAQDGVTVTPEQIEEIEDAVADAASIDQLFFPLAQQLPIADPEAIVEDLQHPVPTKVHDFVDPVIPAGVKEYMTKMLAPGADFTAEMIVDAKLDLGTVPDGVAVIPIGDEVMICAVPPGLPVRGPGTDKENDSASEEEMNTRFDQQLATYGDSSMEWCSPAVIFNIVAMASGHEDQCAKTFGYALTPAQPVMNDLNLCPLAFHLALATPLVKGRRPRTFVTDDDKIVTYYGEWIQNDQGKSRASRNVYTYRTDKGWTTVERATREKKNPPLVARAPRAQPAKDKEKAKVPDQAQTNAKRRKPKAQPKARRNGKK